MPKKYFVAKEPILFDSLDEIVAYVDGFKLQDLEGLVIGGYLGELKLDTNFVLLGGNNKIKRLKVKQEHKNKENTQAKQDYSQIEEEKEEIAPTTLQCSFCHRPKIKTTIIDKMPTHLCEEHLSIEKEILNASN